MKKLFLLAPLFFILLTHSLFGEEIYLKDQIREAKSGNYLVTFQDKNFTFLHIYDRQNGYLILEEVNVPAPRAPKDSWKEWFERGAPGNTSWTHTRLNLTTGRLEASYSFTYQRWLNIAETDHFMATLLNLKFYSIPDTTRRRIGPTPGYGREDLRPIWQPKLVMDGRAIPKVYFKAFKARWPNDRSELASKKIEIYLPEKRDSYLGYPTFFPYWVEVEGKLASGRIRVIDSGEGVQSIQPPMPPAHRLLECSDLSPLF